GRRPHLEPTMRTRERVGRDPTSHPTDGRATSPARWRILRASGPRGACRSGSSQARKRALFLAERRAVVWGPAVTSTTPLPLQSMRSVAATAQAGRSPFPRVEAPPASGCAVAGNVLRAAVPARVAVDVPQVEGLAGLDRFTAASAEREAELDSSLHGAP